MKRIIFLLSFAALSIAAAAQEFEILPQSVQTNSKNMIALSPDGRNLITSYREADSWGFRVWDAESGRVIASQAGYKASVSFAAYDPTGKYFVTVSDPHSYSSVNGIVSLWETKTGNELFGFQRGYIVPFTRNPAAFSPDSTQIAFIVDGRPNTFNDRSMGGFGTHDLKTGEGLRWFSQEAGAADLWALAWSPDGKYIAASEGPGNVKILDAQTGEKRFDMTSNPSAPVSLIYSPDGRRIAGACGRAVKIWDAASGREVRTMQGNWNGAYSLAYSPDGKRIAVGCVLNNKARIILFDASNGRELQVIEQSSELVSMVWSPGGAYLAAAFRDGTARLIDPETGEELVRYISYEDGEWICISPDGYYNASPRGDTHLNVLLNDEVYGIDQFRQVFYQPLAVQARIRKENFQHAAVFAPPEIRIQPADSARGIAMKAPEKKTRQYGVSVSVSSREQPIKTVKILVNGRQLGGGLNSLADSRAAGLEGAVFNSTGNERNIDFTFSADLDAGPNRIEVIASNAYAEARKTLEISYEPETGEVIPPPALWILAIGVNSYDDPGIPGLSYCVNDAQEIINTFKEQETRLYSKVNTLLLSDGGSIVPSAENIRENLRFLSSAGSRDVVIVFLAGHGVSDESGNFFFLPSDAAFSPDGTLLREKAINSSDIFRVLNEPGNRLVFIDACHSGGLSGRTNAVDNDRLVRSLMESNAFIFTSSKGNELSQERSAFKHGVFTYSIIQGLNGSAETQTDGSISMMQLCGYVSREVKGLTNDKQHPGPYTLGFDDFIIARTR
jgi:WD40 repeat protein